MKRFSQKLQGIVFVMFMVIFTTTVINTNAATYTVTTNSNWSTCSAFTLTPTSSDDIIVTNACTLIVDVTGAVCNTMTISPGGGGGGTLDFATSGSPTLTVSGLVTNGTVHATGYLDLENGATLTCGSITSSSSARNYNLNAGTLVLTGSFTLPNDVNTFNNLTISGSVTAGSNITISGNLTGGGAFLGSNFIIDIAGSMSVSTFTCGTSTVKLENGANIANAYIFSTLEIASGSVTTTANISATTINVDASTNLWPGATNTVTWSGVCTATGNLIVTHISDATDDFAAQFIGGTFSWGSSANLYFSGAGNQKLNTVVSPGGFYINNTSGTVTFTQSETIIGSGTNTQNGSTLIVTAGNTFGGNLYAAGTLEVTATGNTDDLAAQYTGTLIITGAYHSTIDFVGGSAQNVGDHSFYNLAINNTGGLTLTGTNGLSVSNTLSGSNTLTAGSQSFSVSGAFTVPFSCGSSTVTLNGTSTLGAYTFYNLVIANPSGITLTGNVTVNANLNFTSGALTLGANNLTIGSSGSISGYNNTRYVQTNSTGTLEMTTSGSTFFPIGDGYNPITIRPTVDGTFDVGVSSGLFDDAGASTTSHAVGVTWTVTPTSGSPSAYITPQWNLGDELTSFDRTNSYVTMRTTTPTGTWVKNSVPGPAAGSDPYTMSSWLVPLTLSTTYYISVADNLSPLPVTLVSFGAVYDANHVNLTWNTASEINNNYFGIERSADGETWKTIGQVAGHGNSMIMENYTDIDNLQGIVPTGSLYYRLKQVDFNGAFMYSEIRSVTINGISATVSTYPNPVANVLNVNWTNADNSNTILKLVNMSGATIYTQNVTGTGNMNQQIDLYGFAAGTYFLQIVTDKDVKSQVVYKN